MRGGSRIALIHDVERTRLAIRTTSRAAIPVSLPAGFGNVYAIYPVARAHQDAPIPGIEFAVVGSGNEHAAIYVRVDW